MKGIEWNSTHYADPSTHQFRMRCRVEHGVIAKLNLHHIADFDILYGRRDSPIKMQL